MSFYCSPDHWRSVRDIHCAPCENGHDKLSQCQIQQEIRVDVEFANRVAGTMEFMWVPERLKSEWTPLKDSTWEAEYSNDALSHNRVSPDTLSAWIRAASDALSMPMTIIYALQHLNNSDDWTRRDTLTIHVRAYIEYMSTRLYPHQLLGASETEVTRAKVFEEIFHRLPEVRTLKVGLLVSTTSVLR